MMCVTYPAATSKAIPVAAVTDRLTKAGFVWFACSPKYQFKRSKRTRRKMNPTWIKDDEKSI